MGMARPTIEFLERFWKSRSFSLEIKKRLLETLIWPVAMYGCESWTLKAADRRRLAASEMTYRINAAHQQDGAQNQHASSHESDPKRDFMTDVRRQAEVQNLATSILHCRIDAARGRGPRRWMDDIKTGQGCPQRSV